MTEGCVISQRIRKWSISSCHSQTIKWGLQPFFLITLSFAKKRGRTKLLHATPERTHSFSFFWGGGGKGIENLSWINFGNPEQPTLNRDVSSVEKEKKPGGTLHWRGVRGVSVRGLESWFTLPRFFFYCTKFDSTKITVNSEFFSSNLGVISGHQGAEP